jgi:hypothetical protein
MNDETEDRDDPIVAEVRRARASLLAEYNGDLDALAADMQRRTEEARLAGRKVVSLPPRRPKGWSDPARKVG